jgi:hypothetical protein
MKTPGQLAYEEDVRREPKYDDGTPRITWAQLGALKRESWERNPTVRAKERMTFEVMTPENTAEITLNDNLDDAKRHSGAAAPTETWLIGRSPAAIWRAILAYAKKHGITPRQVGYAVKYSDAGPPARGVKAIPHHIAETLLEKQKESA